MKEPSEHAPRNSGPEDPEGKSAEASGLEGENGPSAEPTAQGGWFRRLTFFSLLAGLCPLIPVPFLDDWVLSRVRLRMGREILAARSLTSSKGDLRALSGVKTKELGEGCLSSLFLWPLIKVSIYLVKKVFRKIILILTLKECSDRFSEVFHEGYLLHSATIRGDLGENQEIPSSSAQVVRQGIVQACEEVDPRPIHQLVKKAFRGSRWLLINGSRRLAKIFRRSERGPEAGEAELEGEERFLASLIDRLASGLWLQKRYWEGLEEHYLQAVEAYRRDST